MPNLFVFMESKVVFFYWLVAPVIAVATATEIPVIDYSIDHGGSEKIISNPRSSVDTNTFDSSVAVRRLATQIDYLNKQNLGEKLEELQNIVQKLTGQLELQAHQIEVLDNQLKEFYQDINRRMDTDSSKEVKNQLDSIEKKSSSKSRDENSITKVKFDHSISAKNSNFLKEQQLYQKAIDFLPDKPRESATKLREYLKIYPQGSYVANAHYWLGEIKFLQKQFDAAEEEFNLVISKYPKSKRVSDAIFKRAIVYKSQGKSKKAIDEWNRLIKLFPKTSAAQLAKQQLANF